MTEFRTVDRIELLDADVVLLRTTADDDWDLRGPGSAQIRAFKILAAHAESQLLQIKAEGSQYRHGKDGEWTYSGAYIVFWSSPA